MASGPLEEVVRPPASSPGHRAVPSPKADLQADGLPQLVEKCELKHSPRCIIHGKNEEIHTVACCGKYCVWFCVQYSPIRAVRDWNHGIGMVGKGL